MHSHTLDEWKHSHDFSIDTSEGERRTRWVVLLTATMMVVEIAAGYLFGVLTGGFLAFAANLAGSIVAFYLARTYAREWIRGKIDHSPRFSGFDAAVSRNGLYTVMFARLALLPNNLINYACGITGMRLRDFIIGTSVGILPILAANILIGASTMDFVTAMEAGGIEKEQPPLMMLGAIIPVMALVLILARRYSSRLVSSDDNPE